MNNNPKSNTRQYSTTTYSSRNRRNKKHSQNKLVFFILLALLIIALIVAIVFVVADLVGGNEEETSGVAGDTNAPGIVAEGHSIGCAYDNDDSTYVLSKTSQIAGSYFICEFESDATVGSVRLVSSEPDYYIRGCEVQLQINDEWVPLGVFGGGAGDREYTSSLPFTAKKVRIFLTENVDTLWAINEICVKDTEGNVVAFRSAMMCPPASDTNQEEMTTTPGSVQGETTTSPAPETTQKIDQGTTTITVSNDNMYTGDLILVNSNYAFRFPSSQASLLNVYNEYYARDYHCNYFVDSAVQLEAVASHALLEMANALFVEKGINNLQIGTGYRSYETQQDLSTRYPATAALPGYSEHHTGLGIDLQIWDKDKQATYAFDDTTPMCNTILSWMNLNAYKYGFVRRFAPNKDAITQIASDRWHYRYVGVPHAYYMTANDLCLEEYLAALENCTYGGNHLNFEVDGKSYEIYFVPAVAGTTTTIPVPSDPSIYTISGNNYSGFIVTITRG